MHPAPTPRGRLLEAMAAAVRAQGFQPTTVADVVRIAKTSRRTFYEHFDDREACFLALAEVLLARVMAYVAAAANPALPWEQQVDDAVQAYLVATSAEPELMRSFELEITTTGARGIAAQRAFSDRYANLLTELVTQARTTHPTLRPLSQDAALLVVGGLRDLVVRAVVEGRDLFELHAVATEVLTGLLRPD